MNLLVFTTALALGLLQFTVATPTPNTDNQAIFSAKLFNTVVQENSGKNVVISPASIQTCLALAYIGAEGTTADELRQGLYLGNKDISKEQVAQQFGNLLSKMRSSDEAIVKMANRIYVSEGLEIASEFNEVAQRNFDSSAESVNFSEQEITARKINNWVEDQTANKIQNLISPDSLGSDVVTILVNAIYFKANWRKPFYKESTSKKDFRLSSTNSRSVDTMFQQDYFGYGEFAELAAKALSMKYDGTEIQMLVLLPNQLEGLSQLEQQLVDVDLTKLLGKLKEKKVNVNLPKFKIEFEISLKNNLKTLGMRKLFTPAADFSSLFKNKNQVSVSEVRHKAFVAVDEKGTEAAAATAFMAVSLGMYMRQNEVVYNFKVDHPFYFALLDNNTVYFSGHVVNL